MNNTQYNNAGELQGIIISKHDSNFMEAVVNAIEIIDSHPHYLAYIFQDKNRITISQESGNIVSIRIKHIELISINDDSIHIMCGIYSVAIQYAEPQFIIY
jgi:hypothetical protein